MVEEHNTDNTYSNLNVTNFAGDYQEEAMALLKMVNEKMKYYYEADSSTGVDILSIHQIIKKVENYTSKTPGIEAFRLELIEDLRSMVKHYENEISKENNLLIAEARNIEEEIKILSKKKRMYTLGLILLQLYLFPKYSECSNRINTLKARLDSLNNNRKRVKLTPEQLVKISHAFREKYLNVKPSND